jgi:iron complex transport system substrate-binding protein
MDYDLTFGSRCLRALAGFFVALLALAGPVALAEIAVTDFAGREVRLARPAQRIVALSPHLVENVFSAGAGGRLVGAVSYSDFPATAAGIPRVGSSRAWSLEAVLALDPDLVMIWGSGNGMDAVTALSRLGIPTYVSELRSLADIPASIRAIGRLAGSAEHGEREAVRIEQGIAELRARYAHRPRLSVFYQIWHDPLQTINGKHLISKVMELCAGDNIFAGQRALAPQVSLESVLRADPAVILAGGMGEARPDWLDGWRRFPRLRAVRTGALLHVNPDLVQRPTARILDGARAVCEQFDDVRDRTGR